MTDTLPYLSADELASLPISTDEVIRTIEQLIRGVAEAQAWNAPKLELTPPDGRYMMATLSAADEPPYLAVKSLLMNSRNREAGLPAINSLVTLLDSETGSPLAVLDGNWITAIRTAGLSGVAARRLARPDSAVLAFVGCGVQAHSHLQAFSEIFPLAEVRAFNRGRENRERLCQSAEAMGLDASPIDKVEVAVSGADLVVSSVSWSLNARGFIDAAWLKPGAHASIVDLAVSWIADSLAGFDRLVVDDLDQEQQTDRPLVDLSLISTDLNGLVSENVTSSAGSIEKTAFVSRGLAIGDLALAALAYRAWLRCQDR